MKYVRFLNGKNEQNKSIKKKRLNLEIIIKCIIYIFIINNSTFQFCLLYFGFYLFAFFFLKEINKKKKIHKQFS